MARCYKDNETLLTDMLQNINDCKMHYHQKLTCLGSRDHGITLHRLYIVFCVAYQTGIDLIVKNVQLNHIITLLNDYHV